VPEYSAPPNYTVPERGSITDDIVQNADEHPDDVVFGRRVDSGWADVTAAAFLGEVRGVARGLVAAGVDSGDRVAILSRTRYEWTLLDYAIWYVGAVTVPIYETSSEEQIRWILADSGARLLFAETAEHTERVEAVRSEAPALERVVCMEPDDLAAFVAAGAAVSADVLEGRRAAVRPDSLATVIYTSGTTGRPKGCMLTHANFMFELGVAVQALDDLFEADGASTLLFLPLAHIFARIIQVGAVKRRVRLGHSADVANLLADLEAFRPTFILAVPRVFEKVFNGACQRAVADGRGRVFDVAVSTAIAYSRALDRSGPGPLLRARRAVFDRLVYGKLRAALGGRVAYAISGGAPLGERLAHFFRGVGLPVLEGYGLTETTAALTVNLPGAQRIGTVGRPLPGTDVRLGDDGELIFRGGQVFGGYWPGASGQATPVGSADIRRPVDDDGWFRTGDLGEVDDDGFVRITGRKKEILVTAGGKNVAPAVLEDRIRAHALVSQAMVVGEGKPFVAALVTLDTEAVQAWMRNQTKSAKLAQLVDDVDLRAEIQRAIDDANSAVSRAESIRKFAILPVDWTEQTGELTPTLKLKRSVVMTAFHDEVEALYR
jgi:long-chain acyl-CoA synthetase